MQHSNKMLELAERSGFEAENFYRERGLEFGPVNRQEDEHLAWAWDLGRRLALFLRHGA